MIQRQIEHVEVPEAGGGAGGGGGGGRGARGTRRSLLVGAAGGGGRGGEPGQVVARPAGADDHVTLGDRDEVTHQVGRQLEAAAARLATQHHLHAGQRGHALADLLRVGAGRPGNGGERR